MNHQFLKYFENLKMNWRTINMPPIETVDLKKKSHKIAVDIVKNQEAVKGNEKQLKDIINNLQINYTPMGLEVKGIEQLKQDKRFEKFFKVYTHPHDKKLLKTPIGKNPIQTLKDDLLKYSKN